MTAKIEATPKLLTIMSALATGWLPWGIKNEPQLSLCGPTSEDEQEEFILCCGHTLSVEEFDELAKAGLLSYGELDKFGRNTAVITEDGRAWLEQNWIS